MLPPGLDSFIQGETNEIPVETLLGKRKRKVVATEVKEE